MSNDSLLDRTKPPRAGEELDIAKLEDYLRSKVPGLTGKLEVEQFPSGHSNLTYLLKAGANEYVLRRPPFGSKVKTAHDMGREFRVLSHLHPIYPQAPEPVVYEEDPSVMGAPFYLMKRIRGVILRTQPPAGLALPPETVTRLNEALIDNLANLHMLDYEAAGLGTFGKPDGYVERQVTGWTKRYFDSQTDAIPQIEQVAQWLKAKIPVSKRAALIHNDYKFDNLVLDPSDVTKIVGVLDWEMSTIGDPLMDLGTALGYWVEAGDSDELKMTKFGPTDLPGSLTRNQLAQRYAERTGIDISYLPFYYIFALFKTAVVIQQIYYRYKQGLTKDERFAGLIFGVHVLSHCALQAAEASKL